MASRLLICFYMLSLTSAQISSQTNGCSDRFSNKWFGNKCQYICHCFNNEACAFNGKCSNGCASGWFGPACQYVDMGIESTIGINGFESSNSQIMKDSNDDSCTETSGATFSVSLDWSATLIFTWLRIVASGLKTIEDLTITFDTLNVQCLNRQNIRIDNKTWDLICEVEKPTKQIVLSGIGIKRFCSLYISGGRNVALMQNNTSQTSVENKMYSNRAVDGGKRFYVDWSCTHTDGSENGYPMWTLFYAQEVNIQRYIIYNRDDDLQWRLQHFILKGFNLAHQEVLKYMDSSSPQKIYYVTPNTSATISTLEIFATFVNNSKIILTLCEVETYGEIICNSNVAKYGQDCEKICNCAVEGETCFVSTGNCPSGCKAGFYGEGCDSRCEETFYGVDCLKKCSNYCKDHLCNAVNGQCNGCAFLGKQGPSCEKDCENGSYGDNCTSICAPGCTSVSCNVTNGYCFDCLDGFYGNNCSSPCPNTCKDLSCEFTTGFCKSCLDGFWGPLCGEECINNTYGENCAKMCNKNCVTLLNETKTCNHTDGYCLYGCQSGSFGSLCDNVNTEREQNTGDDNKSSIIGAVVGAVCGALVVTLITICIIVWRRRVLVRKSERQTPIHEDDTRRYNNINRDEICSDNLVANDTHKNSNVKTVEDNTKLKLKSKPVVPKKPTVTFNNELEENSTKKAGDDYYNTVSLQEGPTSTVITLANLHSYLLTHGKDYFKKEFKNLPTNSGATMTVGLSEENKNKNRYKNICAYDHSRVHLIVNTRKNHGDYINASYLTGYNNEEKFIASQGPTKGILDDFVRMLWEQKVDKVVMLTNLIELGKQKCEPYWPEEDEVIFGEITVKLAATQVFADHTIRRLQLSKDGNSMHPVTQFHFTSWPDKGVPENPWALVDFEQRVSASQTNHPIVVHCSAGVGRTGTFIALRNVMREAEDTQQMDFFNTVAKLRKDRYLLVQTEEQYVFLHEAAKVAMVCLYTTITSDNVVERFKQLEKKNISGKSKLELEFEAVCNVFVDDSQTTDEEGSSGIMYQNSRTASKKLKNRFGNILPKDCYRPVLMCESSDMEDYINAVLTPSFTKRNQDIITQLPLPSSVLDFCRLVNQLKISLVVAFEEHLKTTDSSIGAYLPADENHPVTFLPYQIKMGSCVQGSEWGERKLTIYGTQCTEEHSFIHLSYTQTSTDPMKLLTFIKHARTYNAKHDARIVYMCRNGATFSGLACVLTLLLDRIDNDLRLTVPLVVGAIKTVRPEIIPTLDQYKLLYQILKIYCETNTIYSNFNDTRLSQASEAGGQNNMGLMAKVGAEYANAKF